MELKTVPTQNGAITGSGTAAIFFASAVVSGGVWAIPSGATRAAATSKLMISFVIASPYYADHNIRTRGVLTYLAHCTWLTVSKLAKSLVLDPGAHAFS